MSSDRPKPDPKKKGDAENPPPKPNLILKPPLEFLTTDPIVATTPIASMMSLVMISLTSVHVRRIHPGHPYRRGISTMISQVDVNKRKSATIIAAVIDISLVFPLKWAQGYIYEGSVTPELPSGNGTHDRAPESEQSKSQSLK